MVITFVWILLPIRKWIAVPAQKPTIQKAAAVLLVRLLELLHLAEEVVNDLRRVKQRHDRAILVQPFVLVHIVRLLAQMILILLAEVPQLLT